MATIKLRILVRELSNVMTQFDQIKVYRTDTQDGDPTPYAEISGPGTRPELVADQTVYEYIDTTAPTSSYWYRTSFFDSTSSLESSLSTPMQGVDAGLYISIQDLRDEGVDDTELTDERAILLIQGWQAWLERMTGNFFSSQELTIDFDGDGSRLLQLPVPLIAVTNLYMNDDFVNAVDPSYYVAYNARGPVNDDRKNPRIKMKRSIGRNIYSAKSGDNFVIGDRNQRVEGTWGYTEADGTTPKLVSKAVKILVVATKELLSDGDIDQLKFGKVIEEVTDRHRVEYADLYNRLQAWAPTGITEVDMVIASYRAPMTVTAPRNMNLYNG